MNQRNPRVRRLRCTTALLLILLCGAPLSRAEDVLAERWRVRTELHSPVNVIVGRIDGEPFLYMQGTRQKGNSRQAAVVALNSAGDVVWQAAHGAAHDVSQPGAYLQWIPGQAGNAPFVVYSYVPEESGAAGGALALDGRSGESVHRITNSTHFGNNNSVVADLDRDGAVEFVYADQRTLTKYSLPSWTKLWTCDAGVLFCWSLPAVVDVNGDGYDEIVFGSEYNNEDRSSSLVALDSSGDLLWRSDGHREDLGSTPVFVADVDGDGVEELVKVGLDLEHRHNQAWNHVHVFDMSGQLANRIPFGSTGIALGDVDRDGVIEGIGISNTRDGGNNGVRAIRCVDLVSGQVQWSTPVERAYLDTNSPIMADINGDGKYEAVVGTGNPAGYARLPDSEPWGDLYTVDSDGAILQRIVLPGWPVNAAFCDLDGDGLSELIVVIDGKPGWLAVYDTKAPARRDDWPVPFGSARRNGTLATKANAPGAATVEGNSIE